MLCGDAERRGPGHFTGVATVVTKLFNMVQPDVAYFGQKDAQQALMVNRLVRDLDIPVRVEVCPTVRDEDGLALSSRNAYLNNGERSRALALSRRSRRRGPRGRGSHRRRRGAGRGARRASGRRVEPEYMELRSAKDLSPVERVNGSTLLAVAARVGRARLIDNTILRGAA